jgi:hypothetical protein
MAAAKRYTAERRSLTRIAGPSIATLTILPPTAVLLDSKQQPDQQPTRYAQKLRHTGLSDTQDSAAMRS